MSIEMCTGRKEATRRFVLEAPLDLSLLDLDARVVAVSPPLLAAQRLTIEDVAGRTLAEMMPGISVNVAEIAEGLADGRPHFTSLHHTRVPHGGMGWFKCQASYWRGDADEVVGYLLFIQDITAEREAEVAHDKMEALLKAVVDNIPATLAVQEMDTLRFLLVNARAGEASSMTSEQMQGRLPSELFTEAQAATLAAQAAQVRLGGDVMVFENKVVHGPAERILRVKLLAFEDACGSPRLLSIGEDVTDLRQATTALEIAVVEAQAAGEAKADFLANMSHEIRTPLTGIIGFSGLLEEIEDLPETARRYIQRIVASGHSLLAVVNDILDFSKLDAHQVELDPHSFDVVGFIEDTVDLLSPQAANKGLALEITVDGGVPALVEADSSRLRQILFNLINNALKFTCAGQVAVSVAYDADGGLLRVAVTDTGPGIASDKLDRLFQRFSQADSSINRSHGGTGLGLAICKGLVELMGGTIGVDSVEGQGAAFWFTIAAPIAVRLDTETAHRDEVGEARPAHILLVDDLAANRELVKAMLAPFGHSFVEADSGAEAVRAALGARFDLIFMDLQMPGMDGLTATRIIRQTAELNRATPIVALSANVLSQHLAACIEAGMDDHLGKPIRPAELLDKVAQWSGGRELADAQATHADSSAA